MRSPNNDTNRHVLGIPLPSNPVLEFFVLAFGIVFFYCIYGYIQEYMNNITKKRNIHIAWFITCLQFFSYAFFSFIFSYPLKKPSRKIFYAFAKVAMCSVGSIGFSNNATEYLNYPTAVIFKCCKLMLVIIVGQCIFGRKYGFLDYSAAILLTLGLAFFSLGDYTVSPKFNLIGVFLMTGSLCADAFIGNLQEQLLGFQKGKLNANFSILEQVFYPKFIGGCILFIVSILNGHFFVSYEFIIVEKNYNFLLYILAFGLVGMIGENFILTLMAKHGVVVTLTTTTIRKIFTILLSFWAFTKPFTYIYIIGGCFTVSGIILSIYNKKPESFKKISSLIKKLMRRFNLIPSQLKQHTYEV